MPRRISHGMTAVPAPRPYCRRGENIAAGVQTLILGAASGTAVVGSIGIIWGVTESGDRDPLGAALVLLTGFVVPVAATAVGVVRMARTRGARGWVRVVLGACTVLVSPAFIFAVRIGFTGH
jgi:ethanolamine transporter EutH